MKRLLGLITALLIAATAIAAEKTYILSTPNTSIALTAEEGKPLYFRYYGTRADADDIFSSHRAMKWPAFHSFGTHCSTYHAVLVKHHDGDTATNLVVESVERKCENGMDCLSFTLKDIAHPTFKVKLHYDAYTDCDVMKLWAEYINEGKKPVYLHKYMSMSLPVKSQDCALFFIDGDHGNENHENYEKLGEGIRIFSTQDGGRPSVHHNASFMLGTDGHISETEGNVIAGSLAWTGNFHIEFVNNRLIGQPIQIFAGINPTASDYTLDGHSTLSTPEFILTYSTTGKGQATRNLHYWARNHHILQGTTTREILLNSWEGVRQDITQDGMNDMMTDFARLGGEMFVMDDGWFGNKYIRDNTDKGGLGDWQVCKKKLPLGIGNLVEFANSKNLKFGIWIEPEMVNVYSELYEKHPDWVLRHEAFEPTYGRGKTQMLLDMANPEVQDFVFSVVDNLMKENPGIEYIKWDHNMCMFNAQSQYLPKSKQSNLYVDHHLGLQKVFKRVREAYPTLRIQLCASGGFRMNYGYMPYFQELWTSDQTDALHRIYIQWGALNFYPANILAAHVCSPQNKYTQRRVPVKFRFDVASMCRMGMEMVPSQLTEAEQEYATRAIAAYKHLRPTIQQGDLYKLISPYDGNRDWCSLMYVDPDKSRAVAFVYRMLFERNMPERIIKFQGLDPNRKYLIKEAAPEVEGKPIALDGKIVSGRYLMEEGVVIPELTKNSSRRTPYNDIRDMNDFRSIILELIAQ